MNRFSLAVVIFFAAGTVSQAATLVTTGQVAITEASGLSVTGSLAVDQAGLDLGQTGTYRVRARVETTSPTVIETTLPPFGSTALEVFGPTVFLDTTTVVGPVSLNDVLSFDIAGALGAGGPLGLGDVFAAAAGSATGSTTLFGFTLDYDFSGVSTTLGGFGGAFVLDTPANEAAALFERVRQAILTNAVAINMFLATLVPPLQIPQDPALDFIAELRGFSFDYAVSVDIQPVPLPATLPLLAVAIGAVAVWRRRDA